MIILEIEKRKSNLLKVYKKGVVKKMKKIIKSYQLKIKGEEAFLKFIEEDNKSYIDLKIVSKNKVKSQMILNDLIDDFKFYHIITIEGNYSHWDRRNYPFVYIMKNTKSWYELAKITKKILKNY